MRALLAALLLLTLPGCPGGDAAAPGEATGAEGAQNEPATEPAGGDEGDEDHAENGANEGADERGGTAGPDDGERTGATQPAARLGANSELPCGSMINRALIARNVDNREPVGTAGPFEANGEPLHVFLDLNNPNAEATMTVRWHHAGSQHQFGQTITAGVSPNWRTWVRHRVQEGQTGSWRVDVFAPGECLAAQLTFDAI